MICSRVCAAGSLLKTNAFEYCDDLETAIFCGSVETEEDVFSYCESIEVTRAEEEEFVTLIQASLNSIQTGPAADPGGPVDPQAAPDTLPSHGRGLWPRDVLKKVSRGLSRVEAGNPGFPRLVQVTSGGFSWWL